MVREKGDVKIQRYGISDLLDEDYTIQFNVEGETFYHTIALQ